MATLEQRVAGLETEVATLRAAVGMTQAFADAIREQAYDDGRASVLGASATPRPPRLRHLGVVRGCGQ